MADPDPPDPPEPPSAEEADFEPEDSGDYTDYLDRWDDAPPGFEYLSEASHRRREHLDKKPDTRQHGVVPQGSPFRVHTHLNFTLDGRRIYAVCSTCNTMFLLTSVSDLLAGGDLRQMVKDAFIEGRDEEAFAIIYEFMSFVDNEPNKEDENDR